MLLIYVLTSIVMVPFNQFNYTQQANFDFRGIFWSNFVKQGLLFVAILIFYITSRQLSLVNLTVFQLIATFAGLIVTWFFTKPYWRIARTFDKEWIKTLFHYGKFVFGTNLGAMLYGSIDKLMLGSLVSTAGVAVYELAVKINNLLDVPSAAMAALVFPESAEKIETEGKRAVKHLYEKSVGIILAFILPVIGFVLLFPEWIIEVIAGEKYLDAVPILYITALYCLFIPFARQFGTVFDAIGKPKINFMLVISGACINLISNYLFISKFGIIGAAYGTLTTYIITFVLTQLLLYRELKVNPLKTFVFAKEFYLQILKKGSAVLQRNSFAQIQAGNDHFAEGDFKSIKKENEL